MREGWKIKTLNQVCKELFAGGDVPKDRNSKFITEEYNIPVFSNGAKNDGLYGYTDTARVSEPSITLSARGTIGYSSIRTKPYLPVVRLIVLIPDEELITLHFLKYVIESMDFGNSGTSIPQLTVPMIKKYSCTIPQLEEQKQIVAILDKAFTAIDQAKANIEKNIENAKELFQSKLNDIFSQKGEDWEEKKFKDVCVLQRGFDLPKRLREQGENPLVSSSGIIDTHVEAKVKAPGVVTGRSGSIGNLFYIEEDFWPLNTTLYIKDFKGNFEEYVYYFIKQFDLKRFSSGAGVPTLNRNFVHDEIVFSTNNIELQKKIVNQLNGLKSETKEIENQYQQKLNDLEDLKKSILQKAFTGELTSISSVATRKQVILN